MKPNDRQAVLSAQFRDPVAINGAPGTHNYLTTENKGIAAMWLEGPFVCVKSATVRRIPISNVKILELKSDQDVAPEEK